MTEIKNLGSLKSILDGTEIVPVQEAAGGAGSSKHTTTQAVANIATALGSWNVFTGDTPWGVTGALFPLTNTNLEDGPWVGLGANSNETDLILTRSDANQESFVEVYSNPNDNNIGSGFTARAYNATDPTTQGDVQFSTAASDSGPFANLSITTTIAGDTKGIVLARTSETVGALTVKAGTGQTDAILELKDASNNVICSVDPATGDVEVAAGGGVILRSPNLNRWRIAVSNAGVLSAVAL